MEARCGGAVLSPSKEPFESSLPLIVAGLIMSLVLIAGGVDTVSDGVSVLLGGITREALEVKFSPGVAFIAFTIIMFVGLAVITTLQLLKIKPPAHIRAFILSCMIFGGVAGLSARIISPYAVGYYLESIGYTFCEYRTVRGFREVTELSWVRYEAMCEDEIDLTGLTEAKLQEHLRTEEGASEKAEGLGIFLK